jgi:diguanylate cyclase (GGDEF)-like protein/PAS domain S-box-containing protein
VEVLSLTLLKLDAQRLMAVIDNITTSVRRERELQQNQAWIHTIVKGVADYGLATLDARGHCRDWNASLGRVTGFDADSIVGHTPALLCSDPAAADERLPDRLREADATGWSLDEGWMARPDGTRYWGSSLIAPLRVHDMADPGPRCYSLIVRDISHLREARESLHQLVSCDHLTGLANRRAFFEGGELEIVRSARATRPLSLVMIDADHFKRINDEHGHPVGDAVLRHLAAGLSATFRSTDLVARVGGEEFAALLPGADAEQARRVAERLCHAIAAQVVQVDGKPIRYTVSAGVATLDAADDGLDGLLRRADQALYDAKRRGRNGVVSWTEVLLDTSTGPAAEPAVQPQADTACQPS